MNKRIIILISGFLLSCAVLQGQSLKECPKAAAEENIALKSAYIDFQIALEKVTQVNKLPDPSLSFGYFINPIETRLGPQRARVSLMQMFPWFGTLSTKKDQHTLLAESKFMAFLDAKNNLSFQVKNAYYLLWENQKHIQQKEQNQKILESYKKLTTSAFSNGKASMSDVIRVDLMMDHNQSDILILKDKSKPLHTRLCELLNCKEERIRVDSTSLELPLLSKNYRVDSLVTENPKIKGLEQKMDASKLQQELARKNGLPKFGIGINYFFIGQSASIASESNGSDALMPAFTVSLPIFRSKYNAAVKEAELKTEGLNLKKEDLQNKLLTAYEVSNYDWDRGVERYHLFSEQILKTKQLLQLLSAEYSNSGKNFVELLRTQEEVLKYEMERVSALKDCHLALAHLDYLTAKSE